MKDTSIWLQLGFMAITALSVFGLYRATRSKEILGGTIIFMLLTAGLSWVGFYNVPDAIPPRIPVIVLPSILGILWVFLSKKGKSILDSMDFEILTLVHTVRVPVELTILALYLYGLMPESMTFEGRNFDILSGMTAPFIAYYGYRKLRIGKTGLIIWNIICLLLVIQVVATGILSAPSVLQQIHFDQPNVAVLHFPYVWLPAIVVPIVVFAHVATIRNLVKG